MPPRGTVNSEHYVRRRRCRVVCALSKSRPPLSGKRVRARARAPAALVIAAQQNTKRVEDRYFERACVRIRFRIARDAVACINYSLRVVIMYATQMSPRARTRVSHHGRDAAATRGIFNAARAHACIILCVCACAS